MVGLARKAAAAAIVDLSQYLTEEIHPHPSQKSYFSHAIMGVVEDTVPDTYPRHVDEVISVCSVGCGTLSPRNALALSVEMGIVVDMFAPSHTFTPDQRTPC